jgi:hypothetical protein
VPSVRHTEETEFGLLPTIIAQDGNMGTSEKVKERVANKQSALTITRMASWNLLPTPTTFDSTNSSATMKSTQVKEGSMHSMTLTRMLDKGMLPTPTAQLIKHSHKKDYWDKRIAANRQQDLSMIIHGYSGMNSQLNPRFVAEMMGFPPNWTELPFQNGGQNPSKDMEMQ